MMSMNVNTAYKNSLYEQMKKEKSGAEGLRGHKTNFLENFSETEKVTSATVYERRNEKYDTGTSESKLSARAQDFLKSLREKYKDYDFFIGNKSDDLQSLVKSGRKEFSVIFSSAELERMANDEKYAEEKMQGVEDAVRMSIKICEENGYMSAFGEGDGKNGTINKISVLLGDDGNMKIFAELEKTSKMQRERMEEARGERKTREEKISKKDASEKTDKKNPYGKDETGVVKRTILEAVSVEEMIEKIRNVNWEQVAASKAGDRINFTA